MKVMKVSTDAEQKQSESNKNERQQDCIDHRRQTAHASGNESENRKQECRENNDQSGIDDMTYLPT